MKTNPCEDCLIYPICRNQLLSYLKKECSIKYHLTTAFTIYKAYKIKIEPKCDLIESWLEINGYALKYDTIAKCIVLTFNIKNYKGKHETTPM